MASLSTSGMSIRNSNCNLRGTKCIGMVSYHKQMVRHGCMFKSTLQIIVGINLTTDTTTLIKKNPFNFKFVNQLISSVLKFLNPSRRKSNLRLCDGSSVIQHNIL
jgi:hypothetical protein